ncbi:MAG: hypothetical protein KatS3mg003_1240 [Candidatus Nitrosocaldaceae archaeon]|nr:MAG: hypothetical protein KatS3mg003_1240 [Candidatus Nitrosocaldaceae archaeon]
MSAIKRDRLDIMLNILEITKEPIKKTHILYRANINHQQLTKYLAMLEELGMITESNNSEYVITDKGRMFLDMFSKHVLLEH